MSFQGLIEFGAQQSATYFSTQATFDNAQGSELDGSVIDIAANDGGAFNRLVFSENKLYTPSDLSTSASLLASRAATGWGRCRYNWGHCQLSNTSSDVDWFDSKVRNWIGSLQSWGAFTKAAGLRGVWLDPETYDGAVWTYSAQAQRGTYSFEAYKREVKQVAEMIVTKWRQDNPAMDLMIILGYEYPENETLSVGYNEQTSEAGLYRYFLDGIIDAWGQFWEARGRQPTGKIILCAEGSYLLTSQGAIQNIYNQVTGVSGDGYQGNSSYFGNRSIMDFGLALYIDAAPFDPVTPNANYFTPATFKTSLGYIADLCEWCWVYNYTYRLVGTPTVGSQYVAKIREFRSERGLF